MMRTGQEISIADLANLPMSAGYTADMLTTVPGIAQTPSGQLQWAQMPASSPGIKAWIAANSTVVYIVAGGLVLLAMLGLRRK